MPVVVPEMGFRQVKAIGLSMQIGRGEIFLKGPMEEDILCVVPVQFLDDAIFLRQFRDKGGGFELAHIFFKMLTEFTERKNFLSLAAKTIGKFF